jgi:dipeptidyl aminopeptidase/acylaminoacyl peptidase
LGSILLLVGLAHAQNKPAKPKEAIVKKTAQAKEAKTLEQTPLIPRKVLFGNPERASVRLCSDGSKLAWLAPVDGVLNVWVAPRTDLKAAKPVTKDTHRGIRQFFWAFTNEHILYLQDKDGDEDWHVYSVDLKSGDIKDLTPIEKISAQIDGVSEEFPTEISVGINDRGERHFHDLYRINIVTGERKLAQENPGFAGFVTDNQYNVRLAVTFTPDAGQLYLKPDKAAERGWSPFMTIGPEDGMTTSPMGFNKAGDTLYMLDSRDRNTAALEAVNPETGEQTVLAEGEKADIDGAIFHPTRHEPQAVSHTYSRTEWKVLDDEIKPDLDYLKTVADGEAQVTSRTLDDKFWTVAYVLDNGPVRFYLYDRAARKAEFLFTSDSKLEGLPLVKMHEVLIRSADDLELVSYLSLPPGSDADGDGRPDRPLPMVLLVHGGPWARDGWGFDPEHQLLANRGYAVLSVNYRGSTGLGKAFLNAADKQWAAKMHDDLVDAVNWAIEEKIAERDKVAIMGGSYGGYATLVGLTYTPELFACGVDIVGPSNLITLMQNPPPYWMPFMSVMHVRVGDVTSEEGRKFLESRSPLFRVEKIQRPLLIAQGAQDPRVKQAESDQIVEAMNAKKIPVTYMLFPEEGHGFAKPENRFAFYAVAEGFLAEHLGGRYQPIEDAFSGAKFTVPSGAGGVPGLKEALP